LGYLNLQIIKKSCYIKSRGFKIQAPTLGVILGIGSY